MNKLLVCCFFPFLIYSQGTGKVWTELGVKGEITSNLDWAAEANTRFGSNGVETFFPQVSLKYKAYKWFRPSADYRAIFDREKNGNYSFSNRLNLNAEFKHLLKRTTFEMRFRYQYSFNRLVSDENYDAEFDEAFRIKPSVSYDINNSIFSPVISLEYFYNPAFGDLGKRFTKLRMFAGVELELDGPHKVSFGYIFDQRINLPNPRTRHILSLSYAYSLKTKNDD